MTKSIAKAGAISSVVPMVSHVDHTEHDVDILVTEQGLADLRGLAPRERARVIIDNCVHPDFREAAADLLHQAFADEEIDAEFEGAMLRLREGEKKRAFAVLQEKVSKLGVSGLSGEEKQQYLQALK